jgi:hypothetical protein
MEYYLIPPEEAELYNAAGFSLRIVREGDMWGGTTVDYWCDASMDISAVINQNGGHVLWDNIRQHLLAGLLAPFRVNKDLTTFQAPTAVAYGRVDVPCRQCGRPVCPGDTTCWWCTCTAPGRKAT